jgi:hypothetical protein
VLHLDAIRSAGGEVEQLVTIPAGGTGQARRDEVAQVIGMQHETHRGNRGGLRGSRFTRGPRRYADRDLRRRGVIAQVVVIIAGPQALSRPNTNTVLRAPPTNCSDRIRWALDGEDGEVVSFACAAFT